MLEELDLAPDGDVAVVGQRSVERGRYVSRLLVVSLDRRAAPVPLTSGRVLDRNPSVSPTGDRVAFLRRDPDDDDAPAVLCTVPLRGGAVRRWAPRGRRPGFGAISEIVWSPDGRRLAFTAEVDPPRFVVGSVPPLGSSAARDAEAPTARHITRADWRWDEEGHRDRWSHLFVLDMSGPVSAAVPRQVTSGDWGASGITWHPDARTIAFVADRGDDPDLHPRPTIWSVDVDADAAHPRSILDAAGGAARPAYSPDGRWVVAVATLVDRPLDDVTPGLVLAPADGSAPPRPLSPELDRPIGNWADTDLNGWTVSAPTGPLWLDDTTIVAAVTDRGRSLPERWLIDPVTGDSVEVPTASPRSVSGPWADATTHALAVAPARPDRVVVLGTLGTRAMELMTVDLAAPERAFATWTTAGSAWSAKLSVPDMRRVDVPGPGGPIETWIASPHGAGDVALPTIVDVHGGPLGCWAPAPSLEVTMLTGAGYRVVLPNIRGSAGYGADWIRPQLGDWGGVDADDVHATLDHVVDAGLADPDRLGALGLSYGGFMVQWLVGTSQRFAAAVSENGVTNQVNTWANSDSGPEYDRASLLGDPYDADGIERLWRQSPLRHVAAVRTPLLMLQAEADLRCPAQDNEQFFVALRHLRRTVEYVLYPDEFHVYAASGRPDRRIDRMTRVLDWFDRYL